MSEKILRITESKDSMPSRDSQEIQDSGNILLDNVLEEIRQKYQEIKINKTSEEHQKDRGVDFQIELIGKLKDNTIDMFKLQVKATDEPVTVLKTTENKGLISFQIDHRHIRYYQKELPWALLFLLCDISTKTVYWYAIQLDNTLQDRVEKSKAQNKNTIQVYINPKNVLGPDSFIDFIKDASESKRAQFFGTSEESENLLTADTDFQVDKSKSLLDQLYTLLEYLYAEVRYLPLHLLVQYYPFNVSQNQSCFYDGFKLYTDNDELVEMFDSFKIQSDGKINFSKLNYINNVDNYEKKVVSILEKLSQNHIYRIVSKKSGKDVSTRYFKKGTCNCVTCCYSRLEIPQAIEKLQLAKVKTLDDKVKTAYMHYEFGNYLKAAKCFEEIGDLAKTKNKKTLYLITQFNLIKLGKLIKQSYYEFSTREYGSKLTEINLDKALYSAPNRSHHRKLFNYIKEVRFFFDSSYLIQTAVLKLRDEYQSYIRGGSFITHSYRELINGFAQLSSFIGGNRIVYDRFSEYKLQVEEFTEGIFIALALRVTNSNVISDFNDYHIQRLIFEGKHKVIWRYFMKYHFKSIPYKESDGKFFSMINNLFNYHHLVYDAYKAYSPDEGSSWRNPYPDIFANCICLAAMIEMDNNHVEDIVRGIKNCISKSVLPNPDVYNQINSFFSYKRVQLSTSSLMDLIEFFLEYKDNYLENRLDIFTSELEKRQEVIKLSDHHQKQLFDFALEGDMAHFNTLISFYPISDAELKENIKNCIVSQLNDKFDAYNYYNAAIADILPFMGSEFSNKFIDASYPDQTKSTFKSTFLGKQDNEYFQFDMFLNLCFKFNVLPEEITNKNMKGFGQYYDWLLDLNGFNYENFKISWLSLYPTKFYFQEFAESKKLKSVIEEYLRKNRDPKVERLYFDIYYLSSYDSNTELEL